MTAAITSFSGAYRFLSNFWVSPASYDGIVYRSSEHAYQAAKTLDYNGRQAVFECETPAQAKRMGRRLDMRPDWEQVKIEVMTTVVRDKFTRSADLQQRLIATGAAELIEGNTWGDYFWGVCKGSGSNHLGIILMKIRDELNEGDEA